MNATQRTNSSQWPASSFFNDPPPDSRCKGCYCLYISSPMLVPGVSTVVKIVKLSHTRYRALGLELIPEYRQSTCMWLEAIHPAVGCHYFPPGLLLPSQLKSVTAHWPVPNYTAWWQRHMHVSSLPKAVTWKRTGRDSNPQPFESRANALPLSHTSTAVDKFKIRTLIMAHNTHLNHLFTIFCWVHRRFS